MAQSTPRPKNKNRVTSPAYFLSRLRDSGYRADRLYDSYAIGDARAWTIVIDPGGTSVLCTCLRGVEEAGDAYFELYDAKQNIPQRFRLDTESIEVVITYLNNLGIVNKTAKYNVDGPRVRTATP